MSVNIEETSRMLYLTESWLERLANTKRLDGAELGRMIEFTKTETQARHMLTAQLGRMRASLRATLLAALTEEQRS